MEKDYMDEELEKEEPKPKSRIWSVLGFIGAVLSVIFCFLPVLGIIFGIVAIGLSVLSRIKLGYFDGFGIAALLTGIFGIVFSAGSIILELVLNVL